MKSILITVLMVAAQYAVAQSGPTVTLTGGLNLASLQNPDDRAAGKGLEYIPTFRPSAGLEVGYRFAYRTGLSGIFVGVQYAALGQKYTGSDPTVLAIEELTAHTDLKYVRVPLYAQFHLPLAGRTNLTLRLGAYYAWLIKYREVRVTRGTANSPLEGGTSTTTIENFAYESDWPGTIPRGEYGEWLYNRTDWGPLLGLGAEHRFGKAVFLSATVIATHGIPDVENKGNNTFDSEDPYSGPTPIVHWDPFERKHGFRIPGYMRPETRNFTVGLQIGLGYRF